MNKIGLAAEHKLKIKTLIIALLTYFCFTLSSYADSVVSKTFAVDLGMNGVPVLDQESSSTCAIFAVTAIINAIHGSGDYISQQCLLELGVYLQSNNKGRSGWDGMSFTEVLNRINTYGIVNKNLCPNTFAKKTASMNIDTYTSHSSKLWAHSIKWKRLVTRDINQVKMALNNRHRIAMSAYLNADNAFGTPIFGNWSGLYSMEGKSSDYVGQVQNQRFVHAFVIIGYDDAKNMLKLRNSWSQYAGDKGDFYMAYDYYKSLSVTAVEIY